MFTRRKPQICLVAVVAACAALTGTFLGEPMAYGQGAVGDYVDLGLVLEAPLDAQAFGSHDLNIVVVNNGTRAAYDVEVVVDVEYPSESGFTNLPEVPVGSASLDGTSLRWTIPALGGLQREAISARVTHRLIDPSNVTIYDNSSDPHELFGEVTTESFDSNPENNTARIWSYNFNPTSTHQFVQVTGNYSVNVSVDELSPSPGDDLNFKITANKEDLRRYGKLPLIDLKVDVELTDGLTVTGTPSYATEGVLPVPDSVEGYSNGVFTIGTTKSGESRSISVTLPITVAANAAGSEQCLTAKLTGNPPPGTGRFDDDISDNMAKVCVGAAPAGEQVVLSDGTVDLFTWHPCVGDSQAPCREQDSLELVVAGDMAPEFGTKFQPSQVVVHVPDPDGRTVDANGVLAWSTGFATFGDCTASPPTCLPGGTDRNGALLRSNTTFLDLRTDTTETPPDVDRWGTPDTTYPDWERGYFKTEMSGPGKIATWDSSTSGPASEWGSSDAGYEGNPWITSSDKHLGFTDGFYIEFSKLGTYRLTATIRTPYDNDVTDTTAGVEYSDTETYTFHAGPIQNLEVLDGGSSDVAAGRTAYTILAANNGPENTVDATVKIALPSGAQVEDNVASDGTYSNGQWNLPGLEMRDYRRSQGELEEASLTLILKDGGGVPTEPATATISLTDNSYNVCIGSDRSTLAHTNHSDCESDSKTTNTWHTAVCVNSGTVTTDAQSACTAPKVWTENVCAASGGAVIAGYDEMECDGWFQGTVYEYPDNNNEAKISARGGGAVGTSGAGGPMAPRFANTPVLTWEAVAHVNNWPVYRYQVQYLSGNDWLDLADVPGTQTHFADTGAGSRRSYRVRALNEAGVPGFWSRSASQVTYRQASPPLNVTAQAGDAGEVVVSWEPSSDDGGSPITYYQAQWSRNGTSGWSNACRSDSASQHTCTNTGIPSGETRYYRVAAYAGGLGAWSDLAVATAVAGVPEAPSLSASRATSGSGDNILRAIRLTWSQPRDNGSTIYAYEIDYVDYDQVARKCGTDWQALDGVGGPYSDSPVAREYLDAGNWGDGLEPGAYRCYRVRAVNNTGAGAWSNAASASAGGAVPPDEWLYLDGEADGQNAITLYWGEPHYDGGAPVTGYQLQYSEDGENWRNLTTTSASARSYTHTGRKVGETWHYQIRARNSAGWGGWSYPVTVTIEEGATADLSQPSLTAQARTSTEVFLSWNSLCNPNLADDCENKGVDGYYLEYSEDGGLYGWERLTWLWTDQTTVLDSTVEPGATRYYRVAGYKEDGGRQLLGRWSQVKSVTTGDFSVGAPQNLTIEEEGERGLRLEWDAVTEGRDVDSITGYRIERSTWNGEGPGDFDTSWVARQTNRGIGPYVETGLTPNTQYYYRVAAVTRNGAVPYIGPYSIASIFIPPAGN